MNLGLAAALNALPRHIKTKERALSRIQGLFRGVIERRNMKAGVGKKRSPGEVIRKMTAKLGVLIQRDQFVVVGSCHPLLITAKADWSGRVRGLGFFDPHSDFGLKSVLPHSPFAPSMIAGVPRLMKLTMVCSADVVAATLAGATAFPYSRPVTVDNFRSLVEPSVARKDWQKEPLVGHQVLSLQFTDTLNGRYERRDYLLAVKPFAVEVTDSAPLSQTIQHNSSVRFERFENEDQGGSSSTMITSLVLMEMRMGSVFTDISHSIVYKGAVQWQRKLYFIRIVDELLQTVFNLTQVLFNFNRFATLVTCSSCCRFRAVLEFSCACLVFILIDAKICQRR